MADLSGRATAMGPAGFRSPGAPLEPLSRVGGPTPAGGSRPDSRGLEASAEGVYTTVLLENADAEGTVIDKSFQP